MVNGQSYTLIGVTPDGFAGTNAIARARPLVAAWAFTRSSDRPSATPSGKMELAAPKNYTLNLIARMRPGLTIESAKPRLPALADAPDRNPAARCDRRA